MRRNLAKIISILMMILLFASIFAGCQKTQNVGSSQQKYPMTITDFSGASVTINKKPERIISVVPSSTEILFALGLGDKIVGVSDFDDYPKDVESKPRVGGFSNPNLEKIIGLKPDVIFVGTPFGKENAEKLKSMGITVILAEAKSFDQIYDSISLIGKVTDTEAKAKELIDGMKAKVEEIKNKVKDKEKPRVYFVVSLGKSNWTAGKGTFIDEIINLAGGENVASDVNGWAEYSIEKIVEKNPQVIITTNHGASIEDIKKAEGYKKTDAVKNNKVFMVDENTVVRPSNRIVVGLEEIAKVLHPEAFK